MPKEIEHKFLVACDKLPRRLPKGEHLLQGYLCCDPPIRVRVVSQGAAKSAFLTIKGRGLRVRDEFEYPIPVSHARQLLRLCGKRIISKTRRRIGRWELDEFKGRHKGIWLAEYELRAGETLPSLPAWINREVTQDARYSNVNLAFCRASLKKMFKSQLAL
ncbi:MAG TPA: CYTH domain-containing protein [Planctomycetota bacterium]|nr:CYTH domain-containing protein [Planctomycetota bacterium]